MLGRGGGDKELEGCGGDSALGKCGKMYWLLFCWEGGKGEMGYTGFINNRGVGLGLCFGLD